MENQDRYSVQLNLGLDTSSCKCGLTVKNLVLGVSVQPGSGFLFTFKLQIVLRQW